MKRQSRDDAKTFRLVSTIILSVLVFLILLPILLVVIASVTDENALISSGYTFFPSKLSLDSYYYMVKQSAMILRAYGVTITVTCVGTIISVLITTMLAYPMSRPNFRYRNALAFFVFFTMLFNGGIVASYIMWSRIFQIKDTIWALIVPNYLVTAFNVFLVRNYFVTSVPISVIESAQIDGANRWTTVWHIITPLMKPVIKVSLVLITTSSLKVFDSVFVLTGGGPVHATEVMASHMYSKSFFHLRYGYGSAIGFLLFLLCVVCSWIITGCFKEKEES